MGHDVGRLSALKRQPSGIVRPYQSQLRLLTMLFDLGFLAISLSLAVSCVGIAWDHAYTVLLCASLCFYVIVSRSMHLYSLWRGASFTSEVIKILGSWCFMVLSIIVSLYVFDWIHLISRTVILIWSVCGISSIIGSHWCYRRLLHFARRMGRNSRTYAIVGANDLGKNLYHSLQSMDWLGLRFVCFFEMQHQEQPTGGSNTFEGQSVEPLERMYDRIRRAKLDIVYVTLPLSREGEIKAILDTLADSTASVFIVPDFSVFNPMRVRWNTVENIPLVSVYDTPFGLIESLTKRIFDLVVALIVLVTVAPIMLLIALGIKMTSPGPVIFKQKRYGIDGRDIDVWKFRSMSVVENGEIIEQAKKNDVRITPLGRILRKTSLDELPQFINVLMGTMSVVGPRPHAVAHNEHYRKQLHGYMLRHKVKPGITGLAQVRGFRGETETIEKMQRRVESDLEYINHWSLWLDIKIFFQTFLKGFSGKNAL